MPKNPDNKDTGTEQPPSKMPTGIILDEKYWHFIRARYRMSLREIQTAILACRNFNNEQIAQGLNVKPSTVKTHLRSIYRKTGTKKRLSLLLRLIEDIKNSDLVAKSDISPIDIIEIKPKSSPPADNTTKQK